MRYLAGFLRKRAEIYLHPKLLRHTLGVEKLAIALAERHGLDAEMAAVAALTHDLAKVLPLEEQLRQAELRGLLLYPEDRLVPVVLHGRLAAAWLREAFPRLEPDVLAAVAWHTTGRVGMSPLEMLIFGADMAEEGRDFSGVDILRQKLYDNLEAGTVFALQLTLDYLREQGRPFHPLTQEAYTSFTIV